MGNPFEELKRDLSEIKELLKEKKQIQAPEKSGVDLLKFIPVQEIFKKKICSESTFYAHVRAGEFPVYKFGNLTFVDRVEFENSFIKVERKLKRVG